MSKILQAGEMEMTFIYSLFDPSTNEIRYVGKSDNLNIRLIEHIRKCKYSITHKNNWIKSFKELKINRCTISDVCNGKKKTAGGYFWKYAEQYI